MRNRIRLVVTLLAGLMVASLGVVGCSEDKSSKAGRNILDEVDLARRRCQRATALMSGLTYQVNKEFSPIANKFDAQAVTLLGSDAVNPKALEALKQAQQDLSKALAANTDAPAADVSQGQRMLGQVESIIGDYYAALVRSARGKSLVSLAESQGLAASVASGAALVKYFDAIAASSDKELADEIQKAADEAKQAQTAKQQAQDQIDTLQKELDGLNAASQKLLTDSANLRIQSEGAKGEKKLEMFDEAVKKETEAAQLGNKIALLERQISLLKSDAKTADLTASAALARQGAAQKALDGRKSAQEAIGADKAKAVARIGDLTKGLEVAADTLKNNVEEARAAQADALKHYADSFGACKKAQQADATSREALSGQAAADQSIAAVSTAVLNLDSQLAALVADVEKAYKDLNQSAPPPVAKIKEKLANATEVCQAAAAKYKEAADIYGRIGTMVLNDPIARNTLWVYQAQKAGALAGIYRISPKADERATAFDEARKALSDALARKEHSPYLAEVVRLQQELGLGETGTAPAAPTPPAAPTTPAVPTPTVVPTTQSEVTPIPVPTPAAPTPTAVPTTPPVPTPGATGTSFPGASSDRP